MKGYIKICKSFLKGNLKYFFSLLLITALASGLLSFFIMGTENQRELDLESTKRIYGRYHIEVRGSNPKILEEIHERSSIKRASVYQREVIRLGQRYVNIIYTEPDYFLLSPKKIISGSFPDKENEIMIQRELLYLHFGIDDVDKAIGEKVEINSQEYRISGIYVDNQQPLSIRGEYSLILPLTTLPEEFNILIEFKDSESIYGEATDIYDKYRKEYRITIGENFELLTKLGYGELGEKLEQDARKSTLFYLVVLINVTIFAVSNALNIFLHKNNKNIAIYRLLGLSGIKISFILAGFNSLILLIGFLFGVILAFIASLVSFYYLNIDIFKNLIFPLRDIVIYNLIAYIIIYFTGFLTIYKICRLTPIQLFKISNSGYFKLYKKKINKPFLNPEKKLFANFLRLSYNKFRFNLLKHFAILISIALSISFLISMFDIRQLSLENERYFKEKADFLIEVDFILTEEIERMLKSIEAIEEAQLIEIRERYGTITIPKEHLNRKFVNHLKMENTYVLAFDNVYTDTVDLHLTLIGYNREEQNILGIEPQLEGNVGLIYNKLLSEFNIEKQLDILGEGIITYLEIDMSSELNFTEKREKIKLVGEIDNIIYPVAYARNSLVIVVDKDFFDKLYPNYKSSKYVVNLTDKSPETYEKVRKQIVGLHGLTVIDYQELNAELRELRRLSLLIFGTLVVFLFGVTCFNLYSMFNMRIIINYHEYKTFILLGLNRGFIAFLNFLEALYGLLFAIPIAGILTFIMTKFYYNILVNSLLFYRPYKYPINHFLSVVILIVLIYLLISLLATKEIKKLDINPRQIDVV
ncbi:ABC transporter permease [Anaerobranca gottschalkii]|uniref:ABC-type transport system, involved in lipoprotein release, permease component n=1 Tax=Anaerobranca gottschalkii DSM 13577 TaxID=1120990 RepID=A0A1I0BLV1_9FIRM|nr:ABC transporter permease [Anaerobranca gottschalkii]SET07269.1 ABC-type transport system, involved in lipoprotein release, permease component [Anaerobranca gottschalkii DSM 13577]